MPGTPGNSFYVLSLRGYAGVSLHPNGATRLRVNGATQTAVFAPSDGVIIDPF